MPMEKDITLPFMSVNKHKVNNSCFERFFWECFSQLVFTLQCWDATSPSYREFVFSVTPNVSFLASAFILVHLLTPFLVVISFHLENLSLILAIHFPSHIYIV